MNKRSAHVAAKKVIPIELLCAKPRASIDVEVVFGCMDSEALNYDSSANTDDNSCVAVIFGCMDTASFNFNSQANVDDGSCVPFIFGCMDSGAYNYNPSANTDNNTCY